MADRRVLHHDAGFTLVELLVVIVLLGVVGSVVTTSVVRSLRVSAQATTRVDALTEVQRAHERMTRMIRAADPLDGADGSTMTFTVHTSASQRQRISYALSDRALVQTVARYDSAMSTTPTSTATSTIISDLAPGTVTVFEYYTVHGTEWPDVTSDPLRPLDQLTDIRRVAITLVKESGDSEVPLTTSVFVRNHLEATP